MNFEKRIENSSTIKVWLDDKDTGNRAKPPHYDIHVKTAWEAIKLLKNKNVEEISLDHDLGDDEKYGTGYDVAKFIEEEAYKYKQNNSEGIPPLIIKIHSDNSVGVANMKMAIKNAYKFWEIQ